MHDPPRTIPITPKDHMVHGHAAIHAPIQMCSPVIMCDSRVANMGQTSFAEQKGDNCGPSHSHVRRCGRNPTTTRTGTPTARFSHPSPPATTTTTSHVIPCTVWRCYRTGGGGNDGGSKVWRERESNATLPSPSRRHVFFDSVYGNH